MPVRAFAALAAAVLASSAAAQSSAVPQLSSRPGAAYTLYLNFGGFNYSGTWAGTGRTPGAVPAYSTDANAAAFSAAEVSNMHQIWSRTAELYAAFNINVTTVHPAPAGTTDAQRQAFFESTPRVMQTIIGGSNAWYGGGGGVSYVGVIDNTFGTSANGGAGAGYKTNWVFPNNLSGGNPKSVAVAAAHEDGHALGLDHQARWSNGVLQADYDTGVNTGGTTAAVMGVGYSTTRVAWRVGATSGNSSPTAQNDVQRIQANPGIKFNTATGFADSGVGHTLAAATPLPLAGTQINSSAAAGLITPLSSTNPNPVGEGSYTTDFFAFTVDARGANLSVVLRSGLSTITPGTADPGASLNATLRLLDAGGAELAVANTGLLSESLTRNGLAEGTYYLQISSNGGLTDVNGYAYFDMGSYFLTGSLVPVPEPAFVLVAGGLVAVLARRRVRS